MTDILLYEHPLSPYAQKVKIALREKGIAFDARLPMGIGTGDTPTAFMAASPRGEVPAFLHEGAAIFDSTIILEYIEERWPEISLLPAAPALRAKVRMIEDLMDTHFEAITWGLGELNFFRRAEGEVKQKIEAQAARQIQAHFARLESELGQSDWFNGAVFGWGDLSVIPYVNAASGFGLGPKSDSALGHWQARANARESVATTQAEALASIVGMAQVDQAVKAGLFKRQYRDHRLEWMIKSGGVEVVLDGLKAGNIRFTEP